MGYVNLNLHGLSLKEAQEVLDEAFTRKNVPATEFITELADKIIRLIELSSEAADRFEEALKKRRKTE